MGSRLLLACRYEVIIRGLSCLLVSTEDVVILLTDMLVWSIFSDTQADIDLQCVLFRFAVLKWFGFEYYEVWRPR